MTNLAPCSELRDLGDRLDRIVRPLGRGSDAVVLDLLRRQDGWSRNPAIHQMMLDRILPSAPPPAAWTAGLFVANELTGVVRAGAASPQAHIEAALFVDEEWRRQGIGSMLLEETMGWARRAEATALRFICDRADWPMRHFAEKFGARLDLVFGQIVADINLVKQ
jgi:GNAT superfamily N-acetyltransferase